MQIKQTKHGGGRVMPEAARRCCPVNMYISQSTKPPQAQKRLPEAAFRPALLCYVDVMICCVYRALSHRAAGGCPKETLHMYISQSTKPPQAQKRLPKAAFRPALLCYVDVMYVRKLGNGCVAGGAYARHPSQASYLS